MVPLTEHAQHQYQVLPLPLKIKSSQLKKSFFIGLQEYYMSEGFGHPAKPSFLGAF